MAGLEEVGIPGREFLREALTNCSDPLRAIEEFQEENGILLPSLRPMLPLLDLHGVGRLEFHTSVLEELKERLLQQIENLGKQEGREKEKKLKEMLQKSFPVIKVPALRPVVMCILKNMEHVEEKYLKQLVSDKTLYKECDVQVKRQIWQEHQSLFGDEVLPLLSQYIREKEEALWSLAPPPTAGGASAEASSFFGPSPKQRRQGAVLQRLLVMVGRNVVLYDMVLQFVRTLFLRTRNVHYCTLRVELLMALHDLEIQDITAVDPCHKFSWCLDACIREKNVDTKRSRELQGFLDSIKRGQEQVLGDLSMTLCDPYAINFLAQSALKIITHLINIEGLPRDNQVLVLLLRMLALGLQAWDMISTQQYKEPKLDVQLITKFLPALMSLMVDDQVRSLSSRLPQDDRESAITTIEHSGPPPDAYQAYVQENAVASVLALYYTFHTARQRDRTGVMRVLGTLAGAEGQRAYQDPFLHTLVGHLALMADDFAQEDFCTVVFDEFFLSGLSGNASGGSTPAALPSTEGASSAARHLLRLLWHVHAKLPPARLQGLMKTLQPLVQANEGLKPAVQALQDKVKDLTPPAAEPESSDSPLLSVPVPTPM
ncbi:negative elongation factor B-like [Dermacentor silvarum]|uniref:negative elongation factor B-like n=1 Tax=Dermacentor silvarum TaxID=543639 RepID=UPI00189B9BC2|nr:negative elongation factor B-like [Dermacentor silvarum]